MKKLIAILLIATMLVGVLTVPSFAAVGDVLYSQDFENATVNTLGIKTNVNSYYNGGSTYSPSIVTWENSKALKIDHSGTTWGMHELVPASALAGVTKYTVEFTMQQDASAGRKNDLFGIRVGPFDGTSAVGDWICMRGDKTWKIDHYNNQNEGTPLGSAVVTPGAKTVIRIEVDTEMQIIRLFCDGELKISALNCYAEIAGVHVLSAQTLTYIDDLKVTEGVSEYTTDNGPTAPLWPTVDYTGKQAGEVIFSENFNAAQSIDDLYWRVLDNAGFYRSMVAVSINGDKVNGTKCAQIIGGSYTWGAMEIVPAAAVSSYSTYTVHMKLNVTSVNNRFGLLYNITNESAPTQNSGLIEVREGMVNTIEGYVNGTKNTVSSDVLNIPFGETFDIAMEINSTTGTAIVYVNGAYHASNFGISTTSSALYMIAGNCEFYMDDLMVTAGTYYDYAGEPTNNNDQSNQNNQNGADTSDTAEDTSSSDVTTEASNKDSDTASNDKGGCGSVASFGGVAILMTLGSAYVMADNKKRSAK